MGARQRKGRGKGDSAKKGQKASTKNNRAAPQALHSSSEKDEPWIIPSDMADGEPATTLCTRTESKWAASLFILSLAVYLSNGDVAPSNDTTANMHLPIQMLRGRLTWFPHECPAMFTWKNPKDGSYIRLMSTADGPPEGMNITGEKLITTVPLKVGSKYMLTPTSRDHNEFANTFNVGTGLTFTPVVFFLALFYGYDLNALQADTWLLAHAGKVTASVLVASSVSLVFLSASAFPSVSVEDAAVVAAAYAFGTCAWSVSSQALWQHGPNEFYLSVAIWALVKSQRRHAEGGGWSARLGMACGLAVAMATVSRPTSAVVAAAIGAYFLLGKRSIMMSAAYGGTGAVLGSLQLYYNYRYFGHPLEFGQQQVGRELAVGKTGSSNLWQTPLLTGGATLLFSPSRGLFVFSPFVLFALPAFFFVWKTKFSGREQRKTDQSSSGESTCTNEFEALRPLCISVVMLWIAAFKFFDYWGGWCYGYRPLVDTMPMMMMLLCAMMDRIRNRRNLWRLFLASVIWSVLVQYIGAYAFDMIGWNSRQGQVFKLPGEAQVEWAFDSKQIDRLKAKYPDVVPETTALDIDRPEYRRRLWHFWDSQIFYYVNNFSLARGRKKEFFYQFIKYY